MPTKLTKKEQRQYDEVIDLARAFAVKYERRWVILSRNRSRRTLRLRLFGREFCPITAACAMRCDNFYNIAALRAAASDLQLNERVWGRIARRADDGDLKLKQLLNQRRHTYRKLKRAKAN